VTSTNVVARGARRGRAVLRSRLYYGLLWNVLLRSRAKARHRACVAGAEHTDSHTYTAFHRSPPQLAALTGPVVDHVMASGRSEVSILVLAASNGAEAYTIASELIARRPELAFTIAASDLHEETVAKAVGATYTLDEIAQGQDVPAEFIERTFDRVGDAYVVKEHIRSRVTFTQADLLDPGLNEQFEPADIVLAQNVLFHMPPDVAHRAFANVIGLLRPGAVLLIEGMDLDQRVALTRAAGLEPMRLRTRQIHRYARRHLAPNWWDYYYGCEPYFALARDRSRRYGTIFVDANQSERATASAIATQRSTQEWSTRSGVSSSTW
jgi:chemotaxis methyl-accepting protein methylase